MMKELPNLVYDFNKFSIISTKDYLLFDCFIIRDGFLKYFFKFIDYDVLVFDEKLMRNFFISLDYEYLPFGC